jgi:hypothetical protein
MKQDSFITLIAATDQEAANDPEPPTAPGRTGSEEEQEKPQHSKQ